MQFQTKWSRASYETKWRGRFALLPLHLQDGLWVWLEKYEVRGGRRSDFVEYRYHDVVHRFQYVMEY